MRIRPFEYYAAVNLEDALEQLSEYGPDTRILAGGTDLVLGMKRKIDLPRRVVGLNKVNELDYISEGEATLRIGSLVTHSEVAKNKLLNETVPLLCDAVSLIGSWQIRNIATIGGNLCNASPAADSAGPLLALNARVVVADRRKETEIPLNSFFTGPGKNRLAPGELLKEIIIEKPRFPSAGCYLKLMRKKAVDLSLVGVAFLAEADPSEGRLTSVSIGLGGVAPTPMRALEAESMLSGLAYEKALQALPNAARTAVKAASPISDIRASAEYRRAIIDVYVRRAGEKVIRSLMSGKGSEK